MKRQALPLLVLGAAIAFGTIEGRAEAIAPAAAEQSACKGHETRSYGDDHAEMSATVKYTGGVLTLSVKDIGAQCGAMLTTTCNADIPGELHFVLKDLSTMLMDCWCTFDLDCTYTGVLAGHYKIYLESGNRVLLEAEADITPDQVVKLDRPNSVASPVDEVSGIMSYGSDATLCITVAGPVEVTVFDAAGCERGAFAVEGPAEVSLESLPKGVYIVKAEYAGQASRLKIIR